MVSATEINTFFELNYDRLRNFAQLNLARKKVKFIEVDAIISHSYLNIIEKINSIDSKDIEPYTMNFIKCHCNWRNKITTEEQVREHLPLENIFVDLNYFDFEKEIKHQAIEQVYNRCTDQMKKIIHEVFVKKEINTVRKMATHFNISQPSAHQLIKQLKKDIQNEFNTKKRISEQSNFTSF